MNLQEHKLQNDAFDPIQWSAERERTFQEEALKHVRKELASHQEPNTHFKELNRFRGLDSDEILSQTPQRYTLSAMRILYKLGPETFNRINTSRTGSPDTLFLMLDHFEGLTYQNVESLLADDLPGDPVPGSSGAESHSPDTLRQILAHLHSFDPRERLHVASDALQFSEGRDMLLHRLPEVAKNSEEWKVFTEKFRSQEEAGPKRQQAYEKAADWSLRNHEYANLARLTELTGTKPPSLASSPDALKHLRWLQQNGHAAWAQDFQQALENLGVRIPPLQKADVEASAAEETTRREKRRPRLIEYSHPHSVSDEIATFYVDDLMGHGLERIQRGLEEMNKGHEESDLHLHVRRLGLQIKELQSSIQHDLLRQRNWMREYMVDAVQHELRHLGLSYKTHRVENDFTLPTIPNHSGSVDLERVEEFLTWATNEEVRDFLDRAAARFENPDEWMQDFGGKAWAHIAETARKLWSDAPPDTIMMDHVFDLEHNSGIIFDKRKERSELTGLESILLDHKRNAQNLSGLYEGALPTLTDEGRTHLEDRWRDWEAISIAYNKLRLGYGGPEVKV